MADFTVSMRLTMLDEASAQLRAFLQQLEGLQGVAAKISATLDGTAASIRAVGAAATGAAQVSGFSAALDRLAVALGLVRTNSAGVAPGLAAIGAGSAAASAGTAVLRQALGGLNGALQNSATHLAGTANAFAGMNAAARLAGAGAATAGIQVLGAGQGFGTATTQASTLGDTIKGLVAIWGALKIERFGKESVDVAAQFQKEQIALEGLNLPAERTAEIMAKAWDDSKALKFVSVLDAIQARMAAIGGLAKPMKSEVLEVTLPAAMKLANNLALLGDKTDQKDMIRNLYGLIEARQLTEDPQAILESFDFVQKASLATGGKINARDWEMFLRQLGQGAATISTEGLYDFIAVLDQIKVSGAEGGGGQGGSQRAATAFKMLQAYGLGKTINKQAASMLMESDLLDAAGIAESGESTLYNTIKPGSFRDASLMAERPIEWVKKAMPNIIAYTRAHKEQYYQGADVNDPAAMDVAIQKYFTGLGFTVTAANAMMIAGNPRSVARIEEQSAMAHKSDDVNKLSARFDETLPRKIQQAEAAFTNLKIVIGTQLLPVLTPLIDGFSNFLSKLAQLGADHPSLTFLNSIVLAIGAFSAALYGIAKLVGFEVITSALAGLSGGFISAAEASVLLGVALAGLLGWNFGTWLADLQVEGIKISDWVGGWGALIITQMENNLIRFRDVILTAIPGIGAAIRAIYNIGSADDLIRENNAKLAKNLAAGGLQVDTTGFFPTIQTVRDTSSALRDYYSGYSQRTETEHEKSHADKIRAGMVAGAEELDLGGTPDKSKANERISLLKQQEAASIEAAKAEEKRTLAQIAQANQLAKAAAQRRNDLQEIARLEREEATQAIAASQKRMQAELQAVNDSAAKRMAMEKDSAAKVQEIEAESSKKRIAIWQGYYNDLKSQADTALKAYQDSAKKILDLDKEIKKSAFEGETGVRDIKRGGMSPTEQYEDKLAELGLLAQQASSAASSRDYEAFNEANARRKQLARDIANVPEGQDKDDARNRSAIEFQRAIDDQITVQRSQKTEAESTARTQMATYKSLTEQMQSVAQTMEKLTAKELTIKAKVDAEGLAQSAKAARDAAQATLDANPLQVKVAGGGGTAGAGTVAGTGDKAVPGQKTTSLNRTGWGDTAANLKEYYSGGAPDVRDVGAAVDVKPPPDSMGVPADNLPYNAPQSGWAWVDALTGTKSTPQQMSDFYNTPVISKDQVSSFLDNVLPANWIENIATFAIGTDYVPRTGLAFLHEGEAVTPASQNRANMQPMNLTLPGMGTFPVLAEQNVANQMQYVLMREAMKWGAA